MNIEIPLLAKVARSGVTALGVVDWIFEGGRDE
jgi:hypothetical protein